MSTAEVERLRQQVQHLEMRRDELIDAASKAIQERNAVRAERDALAASEAGLRERLACIAGPSPFSIHTHVQDYYREIAKEALVTPPSPAVERVQAEAAVIAAARRRRELDYRYSAFYPPQTGVRLTTEQANELTTILAEAVAAEKELAIAVDALAVLDRKEAHP